MKRRQPEAGRKRADAFLRVWTLWYIESDSTEGLRPRIVAGHQVRIAQRVLCVCLPACLELGPQPTLPPLLSTPPVIAENENALLTVFAFSCSVCGRLQKVGVIVDSITVGAAKNMRLKCLSLATSGYAFHPPTLRQALRLNEQETVLSAGQRARQRPTSQAGRVRELCTLRWRVEGERERERGGGRKRSDHQDRLAARKEILPSMCVCFWEGENQTSRALGGLRYLKRCCKQDVLFFFEGSFTVARATARPHFRGAAQF